MTYELNIRGPQGLLEATFIPELGMIGNSLRHRGEELFAQIGGPDAYRDRASTFALPFLHPFANRLSAWEYGLGTRPIELDPDSPVMHRDGATGLPIHGVLAASPHWRVSDADTDSLTAELDFGAVPEYERAFPFPHRITYGATITDETLTVTITITPTSEVPVPISFGFHPYLTLPGSDRRTWRIELPVAREALLDEHMIPNGKHVPVEPHGLDGPLADRTFDTSYDLLHEGPDGHATFAVADDSRRIEVEFLRGYQVAQVFAPEGSDFICYEPMTAPVNALRSGAGLRFAQPGGDFSAVFAITVR